MHNKAKNSAIEKHSLGRADSARQFWRRYVSMELIYE